MPDAFSYERLEINSLLRVEKELARGARTGGGLVLLPVGETFDLACDRAIVPALRENGLDHGRVIRVFGSESRLAVVHAEVTEPEVIVADVSGCPADLMYVLGLCHGLGRCPLMVTRDAGQLPFDLRLLRLVEYGAGEKGLREMRRELTRAVRVFLAASRAKLAEDGEV